MASVRSGLLEQRSVETPDALAPKLKGGISGDQGRKFAIGAKAAKRPCDKTVWQTREKTRRVRLMLAASNIRPNAPPTGPLGMSRRMLKL
jgi:hypothetical protein